MPKIGQQIKKPAIVEASRTKEEALIWGSIVWEVETEIPTCPVRVGKLKFHNAVVGEIHLLKEGFHRVADELTKLGVRIVLDYQNPVKEIFINRDKKKAKKW